MGLSEDIKKVEANLKRIASYYQDLNENNPFSGANAKNIAASADEMQKLEDAVKGTSTRVKEIDNSLENLVTRFKSANNEIKTGSEGLKSMNQILSQQANAAEKVRNHQEGISILSVKQLQKESEKIKSAQSRLSIAKQLLEQEKTDLKEKKAAGTITTFELSKLHKINAAIKVNAQLAGKKNKDYKNIVSTLDTEISKEKKVQEGLGITGGILKGISKIPILGDVVDASDAVEEMEDHLRNSGSALGAMKKGLKNIGGQMITGLLNPANMLMGAFGMLTTSLMEIDKQSGEFAKKMNVSYGDAVKNKVAMQDLAAASGDAALNSTRLQESQMAINESLGTSTDVSEETLKTFTKLREQAGFTNEELNNINKLSLINGKSLKKNTAEIMGTVKAFKVNNKLALNEKTILRDVAGASASLQLSLGKSGPALAEAASQARKFGISLEQAEKISESLLDFEGSIEKELSAELLTGKDLNLEKARGLALQGKAGEAAAAMLEQVGSATEYGEMNVIQQKSLAEAMGMSREEMSKSLIQAEALKNIGFSDMEQAKAKYDLLRQTMSEQEAAAALGDEELAKQFEQQSLQEKFNQSIEKLKEIFVNQLMPAIMPIMDMFSSLLSNATVFKGIISAIAGIFTGKMAAGMVQTIAKMGTMLGLSTAKAAAETTAATALTLGAAVPIILGGLAAVGAAIAMYGDDVMSKPGYGKRTLMGPEGAIALNDKDTVIAGTKLFGNDTVAEPGKSTKLSPQGSVNSSQDMSAISSALNTLGSNLNAVASRPINVGIDGQNVINATTNLKSNETGDAMRKNSYQVQ